MQKLGGKKKVRQALAPAIRKGMGKSTSALLEGRVDMKLNETWGEENGRFLQKMLLAGLVAHFHVHLER